MGWVKRKVNAHNCNRPLWDHTISVGDIWQCDVCKASHVVTKIEFEDRPCGNVWIVWAEQAPEIGNTR